MATYKESVPLKRNMRLGKYNIHDDEVLGEGGMGKVVRGSDDTGRSYAVKIIDEKFVRDMYYLSRIEQREIRLTRKFGNRHDIVNIYDAFIHNDKYYIFMELVNGKNINQYIKEYGPMDPITAAGYMHSILFTIGSIHDEGIIHRDIKPSNIMLRVMSTLSYDVALLDFGIAKDANSEDGITQIGDIIGTNGYMSPEQAEGLTVDFRTDIYSLGCVLFFMITGHHAYDQKSSYGEMMIELTKPFPRVSKYNRKAAAVFQDIIDKAVNPNMTLRYQTCSEFADDIDRALCAKEDVEEYIVTIGRMNCDINFPHNQNVSRHHADIMLVDRNGQLSLIFTDRSRNGSLVGNKHLKNASYSMDVNNRKPTILIAMSPDCELNWNDVYKVIEKKSRGRYVLSSRTVVMDTQSETSILGKLKNILSWNKQK